jgi:acyl-[acyl-carrier-protein]-phospholipid O-acyltransferase/long-chain-fatty-acid--[acyl-carrier-protein] ligase
VIQPPEGGWHDTGDIVAMDDQQFITIKGRAKRCAKIAGEMVSLAAVETMLNDLWEDTPLAVLAMPDPRKGERLVLVTTRAEALKAEVNAHLKSKGATELSFPAEIVVIEEMPLLGSGKTDYVTLDRQVRERLAPAS